MSITAWLRGLGLEEYEPMFRANAVDAAILPRLTADDLRDMGITLVGHRRRLLDAIAALAPVEPPALEITPAPGRRREAERRQLTVMFVDLVGSTALSQHLDPEDMGEVIRAYQTAVTAAIERYEGHTAKLMGDGVLAYFGWPRAHEDEAERAVRAGLAVAAAVGAVASPAGEPLAARIGVATGPVVVGDLVGAGAAQEETVVGETPNLAARLQALAPPHGIVISRRTRRLVQGLFDLADLGLHDLKGFAQPVPAWRVLGPSRSEGRFEARHAGGVASLVGREHELGLLLDRWQQAREGDGQVVLLSGEPGIGKSRLVRALRERLAGEPWTPLSHFCSPFHQTSALHPVIELLERAAGLSRDEPIERSLDRLEELLARGTTQVAAAAPLMAALLSLPAAGRYPPLDMSPVRQKEETFKALLAQLAGLAASGPILVHFEDVHWADPTTLELIGRIIERVAPLPALVLITFRPEFSPPWRGQAHVTSLTLNRLSRSRGGALIAGLTGGKALPDEVLREILAKTDGVPLFMEELTKTVIESGLLHDEGECYALAGPLPPLAIPTTLRDSLMARLDRLAPIKEVAQIGAAIGREFDYALLAAVAPLGETELRDALRQLTEAELVFGQGPPPHASYLFKHALLRDAAHESLLKSRRQQLHARIVRALEARQPEAAGAEPEVLARHCTEAGLPDKAVAYWLAAGQRAMGRSAIAEAIAQLTKGLEMLAGLPGGADRLRRELDLQTALAGTLTAAKGFSAPECGLAWARARELCRNVPDSPQLVKVLDGQCVYHITRAEVVASLDVADELLRLAGERGEAIARLIGHRAVGWALVASGEPAKGRQHLEQALALYDPQRHGDFAVYHPFDSRVGSYTFLSLALVALGYPTQALHRSSDAIETARALRHPHSLALALFFSCVLQQLLGRPGEVLGLADELITLSSEQGFPMWMARAEIMRGWSLARERSAEDGPALLHRGLTAYRATGALLWLPYFAALQSETEAPAAALIALDEALARAERTGERWLDAELHRRKGEALLALAPGHAEEAEACHRQSLALARSHEARLWELRAATSLARLCRDQGRNREARELLAPVYGWFTEGFDMPDLVEARSLLDALA